MEGDALRNISPSDLPKLTRRDILKLGLIGTAAGTIAAVEAPGKAAAEVATDGAKKVAPAKYHGSIDEIIKIDPNLKRFDQANTAFMKSLLSDFRAIPLMPGDEKKLSFALSNIIFGWMGMNPISGQKNPFLAAQKPGHTDLDYALSRGGFAVEDFSGSFLGRVSSNDSGPAMPMPDGSLLALTLYKDSVPFPGIFMKYPKPYQFESPESAAFALKKSAKLLGADLIGIAPFEERWLYNSEVYLPLDPVKGAPYQSHVNPFRPVAFEFKPKAVIVLAFEMDYESYKCQPSAIGETGTSMGYARMMETSLSVAYMIRRLGYNAFHTGNATGMSVPLAIQAGLGEDSRAGLLITEEFGPRVRLAKVYTDLDLAFDKPKTFGVRDFCEVCQKCADACPAKAISMTAKTTDPNNKPHNASNQPGIDKWYTNAQKCLSFWGENWTECAVCISVCPYNKPRAWNHDVARMITRVPGLNSLARYLDQAFGYGRAMDDQLMKDYWKRKI